MMAAIGALAGWHLATTRGIEERVIGWGADKRLHGLLLVSNVTKCLGCSNTLTQIAAASDHSKQSL
jgi:hypothetical protein